LSTAVGVIFIQIEVSLKDDHEVKFVISALPSHPELIPDIVIGHDAVFVEHPVTYISVIVKVQLGHP